MCDHDKVVSAERYSSSSWHIGRNIELHNYGWRVTLIYFAQYWDNSSLSLLCPCVWELNSLMVLQFHFSTSCFNAQTFPHASSKKKCLPNSCDCSDSLPGNEDCYIVECYMHVSKMNAKLQTQFTFVNCHSTTILYKKKKTGKCCLTSPIVPPWETFFISDFTRWFLRGGFEVWFFLLILVQPKLIRVQKSEWDKSSGYLHPGRDM